MQCNAWFGNYRSKEEECKKSHPFWSFGWEVMSIWSSMHTLPCSDHISLTTHEKLMILDFLEMGEKDLQLSCSTKFNLKLSWWCNLELKTFPFLAISNYKLLSIFGKFCPDFIFFNVDVWNVKWDLFEHEWSISNHLPPPNPTVDLWLTFAVDRWLGHVQTILSLNLLMKWLQNETLTYTSSIKP